ncbi:nicotinate-nucleotide adenylyltransferase [Clostridium homopropionicum]|uniref:nicotinate-nucleotide adenylyltransferase n=1 Tax=Clostridium homopropionicum TaxID=36844 RepID=UPI003BFA66C0
MKRKGIFGGTFDPIHNGHLHIAYEALYRLKLDMIIFMPSGKPPHKTNKIITDPKIRIELVKAAIDKENKFTISSYEIEKLGLSYTYETLEYYKALEPDTEWYFITGTDCLMDIRTWKNIDRIFKSCKFVVFNRSGYFKKKVIEQKNNIEKEYGTSIIYLDIPVIDISSTEIRNKIKESKEISYLVPKKVEYILNEMKLYK